MKLTSTSPQGQSSGERGSATLILFVLLSIMMILVAVNVRALGRVQREEKWLEQKQIERLKAQPAGTGAAHLEAK